MLDDGTTGRGNRFSCIFCTKQYSGTVRSSYEPAPSNQKFGGGDHLEELPSRPTKQPSRDRWERCLWRYRAFSSSGRRGRGVTAKICYGYSYRWSRGPPFVCIIKLVSPLQRQRRQPHHDSASRTGMSRMLSKALSRSWSVTSVAVVDTLIIPQRTIYPSDGNNVDEEENPNWNNTSSPPLFFRFRGSV